MRLRTMTVILIAVLTGFMAAIYLHNYILIAKYGKPVWGSFPLVWELSKCGVLFVSQGHSHAALPLRNRAGEQIVGNPSPAVCSQGIFYWSADDSSIAHVKSDGTVSWIAVPAKWESCQLRCSKNEVFVQVYERFAGVGERQVFRLRGDVFERIPDALAVETQPDCDDYATFGKAGYVHLRRAEGQVYHVIKIDTEPWQWSVDFSARRVFIVDAGLLYGFGDNWKKRFLPPPSVYFTGVAALPSHRLIAVSAYDKATGNGVILLYDYNGKLQGYAWKGSGLPLIVPSSGLDVGRTFPQKHLVFVSNTSPGRYWFKEPSE